MVIHQGDVYWADLGEPRGSEPGFRRPYIVLQNDATNATALKTILVCSVTSNLDLARAPGNVRLERGEAGLTRACVVNVSQIATVNRDELDEYIGRVSAPRMRSILRGLNLLLEPTDAVEPGGG